MTAQLAFPFRWAIIGPGKIAHKFATGLKGVPGAQLVAVASSSIAKAQSFCNQFGGKAFDSYESMLDEVRPDAVYVATTHNFHHEHSLLALQKGIPVLCEKPLAVNAAQVKDMIATARANHTFLMEAMWTRFLPHIIQIEQIKDSRQLGLIRFIQADFGFKAVFDCNSRLFNPALAGGALLDIGIYPLFLACLLLGEPASFHIEADLAETGVDQAVYMQLKFKENVKAQLLASISFQTKTTARIVFEEGEIEIAEQWLRPADLLLHTSRGTQKMPFPVLANGFEYEAMEVQRCVQAGLLESPMFTHQFSLQLMQLIDSMRAVLGIKYPFE
jgi:predicted dehydrogenase